SEYATAWPGELDFMHATPWAYAWTVAPAPFHLVEPGRHVARVEGHDLVLADRTIARIDIASVDVSLSKDWAIRKVVLVLRSGERVDVATQTDEIVYADPTYDGINLMCETSWASHLGRSLAAALGVSCTVAEGIG
ncbi:MAG TPA: hypothetical protein VFF73_13245, partial [Planctomycetota bacterium]|nr:hypothetical protein [Planctomycetota bacterium]